MVYERKGYSEQEIRELLYKKELELQEQDSYKYGRLEPEPIPEPEPVEKVSPSKLFAIRLKWNLWELIKDKPSKKIRRAIIKCYGKKREQEWLEKINPSNEV